MELGMVHFFIGVAIGAPLGPAIYYREWPLVALFGGLAAMNVVMGAVGL